MKNSYHLLTVHDRPASIPVFLCELSNWIFIGNQSGKHPPHTPCTGGETRAQSGYTVCLPNSRTYPLNHHAVGLPYKFITLYHIIIYPRLLLSQRGWMSGLTGLLARITHTSKKKKRKEKMDPPIKEERKRVTALSNAFISQTLDFLKTPGPSWQKNPISPAVSRSFGWKHIIPPTGSGELKARPRFPVISARLENTMGICSLTW